MNKRIRAIILLLAVIALVGCKPPQQTSKDADFQTDPAVRTLLGVHLISGTCKLLPGEDYYSFGVQRYEDGNLIDQNWSEFGAAPADRMLKAEFLWVDLNGNCDKHSLLRIGLLPGSGIPRIRITNFGKA
jgi:hypothetical protein